MSFIGQAEVNIDKKARLAIPAKFRTALDKSNLGPGWVSMPRENGAIWLIPEQEFSNLAKDWGTSLIPDEEIAELQTILFSFAEPVSMDQSGRITIPRKHLDMTGVDGPVVIAGAQNHLEIHARDDWQAKEAQRLARLPELIKKINASKRNPR